jgi:predicted nuclease of predicted toxin-antitoxin system
MRFLADENFPAPAVTALQAAGHNVLSNRLANPGIEDPDELAMAANDQRILLTFDKDFGELARRAALPPGCGVVLFRIAVPRPREAGRSIARLIGSRDDWADHFSAIEYKWEFPRLCRGGSRSLTFSGVVPGCPPTKLRIVSRQSTRTWSRIDG